LGLRVLEALASGLPCLLSDTPGHREIAGDAAEYFPDGDPEGLADALSRLSISQARARARTEGPRTAARFDAASVAANLEAAFERAGPIGSRPVP
jgi:glycosyltransferase involved in cell wall biosynthesis